MLVQSGIYKTTAEARIALKENVDNGKAFEKLCLMVEAQGGDVSYIKDPSKFEMAKNIIPVVAKEEGYIKDIKALTIGVSSMKLGGGRETLEDTIDMSAGIVLAKKVGDFVKKGDVLCTIYTNKDEKTYNEIIEEIYTAYSFSATKVEHTSVIKEVIE